MESFRYGLGPRHGTRARPRGWRTPFDAWGWCGCWRWSWARLCAVSAAGAGIAVGNSSPDDHLAAVPQCGIRDSAIWRIGASGCRPTIQLGIVPTSCVQVVVKTVKKIPSPNNHFIASPHCLVGCPATRRIACACSGPAIHNGIVFTPD